MAGLAENIAVIFVVDRLSMDTSFEIVVAVAEPDHIVSVPRQQETAEVPDDIVDEADQVMVLLMVVLVLNIAIAVVSETRDTFEPFICQKEEGIYEKKKKKRKDENLPLDMDFENEIVGDAEPECTA